MLFVIRYEARESIGLVGVKRKSVLVLGYLSEHGRLG